MRQVRGIRNRLQKSFTKKDINHLERIQWAATRRLKDLRGLTYEERLQALKLQPLGKKAKN